MAIGISNMLFHLFFTVRNDTCNRVTLFIPLMDHPQSTFNATFCYARRWISIIKRMAPPLPPLKARNIRRGGDLMGVDILLDSQEPNLREAATSALYCLPEMKILREGKLLNHKPETKYRFTSYRFIALNIFSTPAATIYSSM
ncbi:hypothetical protein YC2023_015593 [Brassica napus]